MDTRSGNCLVGILESIKDCVVLVVTGTRREKFLKSSIANMDESR